MTSARASTRITNLTIVVFLNLFFIAFGYEMLGGVV